MIYTSTHSVRYLKLGDFTIINNNINYIIILQDKDMEILIIDRLVIHRIGILMYKLNSGHFPKVLCNFFKNNNKIHNYNTRTKDMFRISHESQIFSSVVAKIWNIFSIKIDVNITLIKFKNSLKLYLLSNTLVINYPK